MPIAKPASQLNWVPGEDGDKVTEPIAGKKAQGYVFDERPPAKEHNFIFARLGNWQKYFESATDELLAGTDAFDAIVGSGPGTFEDINAAVAAVSANSKILVRIPITVIVTQVVNKEGIQIEFHPSAFIAKGASLVTGLSVDAKRVKILGGRFLNFDEGGGVAIDLTSNAKNCHILNNTFDNNTNEINDGGTNNVQTGNIVEVA